uniref:Uncharacterized protein n=1 Tax=Rhizophora mucronata TaxID=61149 RepID=A0A2P2NEU5_RHIMU
MIFTSLEDPVTEDHPNTRKEQKADQQNNT